MTILTGKELFNSFISSFGSSPRAAITDGIIGEGRAIETPDGTRPLVYADYVASGRALRQIEDFMIENVLPYYANTHTDGSFCGAYSTRLRTAARELISDECGADRQKYATIFCGSGATAGLNRLVDLLGVRAAVADGLAPLVVIGPYEHHSNILPWRESGSEVVEIAEADGGGVDLNDLRRVLSDAGERLIVGSFSAASNVTGVLSDVVAVTRILKEHGALSVWDYAGGGPYLPIDMQPAPGLFIDAIAVSPHKFIGGPGASGVLIVRRDAVRSDRPVLPGGGTVVFVSPWGQDYNTNLEEREEAGTPNVLGDIRAGLVFAVKKLVDPDFMAKRHTELMSRVRTAWADIPGLTVLGHTGADGRLPFLSIRIEDITGNERLHHQDVTRLLSSKFGIQARGGCACAGPYGHRLLKVDAVQSESIRSEILDGKDIRKPGWTRLNLSPLMSDEKVDYILQSVREIALSPDQFTTSSVDGCAA